MILQIIIKKTLWKNKLCEQYEPGSTFKIFTLAMALEEKLVSLTETFNCTGSMVVQSEVIHCAKRTGHGIETVRDGLGNSCNPVFMTLGARIGQEKFYNYVTAFGFREKTGVGVPGEQTGYHYSLSSFSDLDLATSSFGQGFKITPLQLISAVCSVANDGNYMQPYIISQITDSNGNVVLSNSPKVVRKTVSKENSDIICSYLEDAVTEHIKKAYIEGYHRRNSTVKTKTALSIRKSLPLSDLHLPTIRRSAFWSSSTSRIPRFSTVLLSPLLSQNPYCRTALKR